ncbi:MAG: hypothetical protein V3S55_12370 [Nitrospiraceae bacterium]
MSRRFLSGLALLLLLACGPEYERRSQAVTGDDLRVLKRADEILSEESVWDRNDDRVCDEADISWSLFCSLHKASVEVLGEYQHRRVALQEVRFAIQYVSEGEPFEHRLMDFNNSRTFPEVKKVLALATERVEARLAAQASEGEVRDQ